MKVLAVIPLLTSVVLAQSSYQNPAPPAATANPYISDANSISEGCKTFLDSFNKDPALTSCTDSLIQATKKFGPGGSSGSPSKAEVTGAVDNVCTGSASSACPDSLIRGKLTAFYGACKDELTVKPNDSVRKVYDVVYAITPLKKALCCKDDTGDYCVTRGGNPPPFAGLDNPQQTLYYNPSPDAVAANLTTFRDYGIPYLFLRPDTETGSLCTPCTRNILTSYIDFESDLPYAPGLGNSEILAGQNPLVGSIGEKCGENFLNGAVQAAAGISAGSISGAVDLSERLSTIFAIAAAGLTVAISSLV